MARCEIRIGTSGWHYPHWRGRFYPQELTPARMLDYYLRRFDTVELNNTFYRLPTPAALAAWREAVPRGFVFAVKGSRFLTHNKKLKDPENALQNLLPRVETLGEKLGPILFQLPPRWRVNAQRLEEFLAVLPRRHRYALELRDPTWHTGEVSRILRRFNAAFCAWDLAGTQSPVELTADFAYVRLHGPGPGKYQGSYSERALRGWAERIAQWSRRLRAVYVYFDNDMEAFAAQDALRLKELLAAGGELRRAG